MLFSWDENIQMKTSKNKFTKQDIKISVFRTPQSAWFLPSSVSDAGRWKTLGGPVVIGGDNLPSPGWNRVNWSAPLAPPVPATLDCQIHNNEIKECCYRLICVSINRQFSKRFPSKKKIFTFNNVNEVHIFWPRKTLIKTVLGIFSNLLFSCGCQKHDQIESTRLGTKKLGFFCET